MTDEEKHKLLLEIKELERAIFRKRSQLASQEARKLAEHIHPLHPKDWKEIFSYIREKIGLLSVGGDSVEEIRKERRM